MLFTGDDIDFTYFHGCCTWLDFSDINVITQANTYISYIRDKSIYHNDFMQYSEQYKPVFGGSYNGKTVAQFFLTNFLVGAQSAGSLGILNNDYEIFFSLKTNTTSTNPGFILANTTLAGHYEIHVGILGGVNATRYIPVPTILAGNDASVCDTLQHVINARVNNNNTYLTVDGITAPALPGGVSPSDSILKIGARFNNAYGFGGHISQVVMYNRALTTQERSVVVGWLQEY